MPHVENKDVTLEIVFFNNSYKMCVWPAECFNHNHRKRQFKQDFSIYYYLLNIILI